MQENKFLYDGFDFDEHEGFIVGNRDGLQELQDAIASAIRCGEKKIVISEFLSEDGDFQGIRCLPDSFFREKINQLNSSGSDANRRSGIKILVGILILFIPFIIGMSVIFNKVFSLF